MDDGLRGDGLGVASAPRDLLTRHLAGAVVAQVGLPGPTPSVGERDPQRCAFSFLDFRAAVVADENRLSSHEFSFAFLPSEVQFAYALDSRR